VTSPVEKSLRELAAETVQELGLSLYHLEYHPAGAKTVLRLYIEGPAGVGLGQCESVSRAFGDRLENSELIPSSYTLEVSSPGLDRPLFSEDDYRRFAGETARIKTFRPVDGRRNFPGRILGCEDGTIRLALADESVVELPIGNVASGRLDPFPEAAPPSRRR
jgi:ribosome maturation factor RimP